MAQIVAIAKTATNLNSIYQGADGIVCDVIQAQLKGRHHHAGLQLAPRGQQPSMGTETQLFLITSHLPWTERLGGAQRVLRLETVLKAQNKTHKHANDTDSELFQHLVIN